ncbi:hypothetical protein BDF14DRAFT_1797358 [Spinellus fusiger]|nr:hypothetical protein BDF14DRAFT_1797358 [Spinellus fusiger]
MGRLTGKTVFITGASSGIGEACAREFAKEGSHLVLAARRIDKLDHIKADILATCPTITVHTVAMDVTDKEQVVASVAAVLEKVDGIDVLLNNAGLALGLNSLLETDAQSMTQMLDTNVKGLVYAIQAVLPSMKKRGTGHIINISSSAGKQSYVGGSVYCGSKHAVEAITKSLRLELVNDPIRVSQIAPGMVKTEFSTIRFGGDQTKADDVYKGIEPLTAYDIAELVVFTASRPSHVNIADLLVFPSAQADAITVCRQ